MTKEDLKNLEDEHDEIHAFSEEQTFEWIEMFLSDVNRIERFFLDKKEQLINEFIAMQERYRLKSHQYEDKKPKRFQKLSGQSSGLLNENKTPLLLEVKDDRASIAIDNYNFFDDPNQGKEGSFANDR